jgi:hypothetical protein
MFLILQYLCLLLRVRLLLQQDKWAEAICMCHSAFVSTIKFPHMYAV